MNSRANQTYRNDFVVAPATCSTSSVNALMTVPRNAFSDLGGHQVDQREDEHPDQVDEVPVEAADFHVLGFELAAPDSNRNDTEVDEADDHVGHVEAGQREEGSAEQRHSPLVVEGGDMFVIDEVQPLGEVQADESGASGHSGQDPADGRLSVAVIHGVDAHHHGETAGEQAER